MLDPKTYFTLCLSQIVSYDKAEALVFVLFINNITTNIKEDKEEIQNRIQNLQVGAKKFGPKATEKVIEYWTYTY